MQYICTKDYYFQLVDNQGKAIIIRKNNPVEVSIDEYYDEEQEDYFAERTITWKEYTFDIGSYDLSHHFEPIRELV